MSGPRRERGVALIIALILVALAAILATKLSFDGWIERRRTVSIMATEQAFHFGMGAEALAADVLSQSTQAAQTGQNGQSSTNGGATNSTTSTTTTGNSNQVTLAQAWAQPTQPMPITPEDDPEGEPIGVLQGAIEDMQGRFNLNNLAHVVAGQNGQVTQDPVPLQQFQRLLVIVGLEPKWAGIARDWIDADDQPGEPDGAEDSVYTSQTPPYRTGNWPMMSPSELMNMPGFGADRYRKIAPYVTALPTATAKINICTAPAPVLRELCGEHRQRLHTRAARGRAQERLLPRQADLRQRDRSQGGGNCRKLVHRHEHVFSAHDPRHAWHYGVHLVQSFVSNGRR